VINLESGIGSASTTHVPLIIPIFTPRQLIEKPKPKLKKRKFTAVEEYKDEKKLRGERKYTMTETKGKWETSRKMFEEFLIVGMDNASTITLYQYPNLPCNVDW
jgi:hypothetical protein